MPYYEIPDHCSVVNGRSNGRSSHQPLKNGRVTIVGNDGQREFRRTVRIVDGEIMDNLLMMGGRLVHRVCYGKFESTLTPKGREVERFRKGGKGKHGKSRTRLTLFGHEGWCHSWYKQGRLMRQKMHYDNGVLAYDWSLGGKPVTIREPDGRLKFTLTGEIDSAKQPMGRSVFDREMPQWFKQSAPFSVMDAAGEGVYAGQHEHGQRVGRWLLPAQLSPLLVNVLGRDDGMMEGKEYGPGVEHFYEHGVAIPKALFETPPEKLDPAKLLKIPNAQLRMAMLAKAKFDGERLAQCGVEVHRQGAMRLIDVPGLDTRILRVQCPSTKSFYYIHVPHDSVECEQARQWTFHVGAGVRGAITFAVET